jgi:hypothetical protein
MAFGIVDVKVIVHSEQFKDSTRDAASVTSDRDFVPANKSPFDIFALSHYFKMGGDFALVDSFFSTSLSSMSCII